MQKTLISVLYCSRKNLSQYFFDESGGQISHAFGSFCIWRLQYRSFKTKRVIKNFTTLL